MSTQDAVEKARGRTVSVSRLRLALRCVSAAGEANHQLLMTNAYRQALVSIGKMLGQRAEVPNQKAEKVREVLE